MKKVFISFLFLQFFYACNNSDQQVANKPENDLDAAATFIRDALDGKWNSAKQYLLQDSVNVQLLETAENKYKSLRKE